MFPFKKKLLQRPALMRRDSGYSQLPAWCEHRQSNVTGVLFLFRKKQMCPNVGPGTKPGCGVGVRVPQGQHLQCLFGEPKADINYFTFWSTAQECKNERLTLHLQQVLTEQSSFPGEPEDTAGAGGGNSGWVQDCKHSFCSSLWQIHSWCMQNFIL